MKVYVHDLVTHYAVLRPRVTPSLGGALEGGVTGARPILSGLATCDFSVHGGALKAAHDICITWKVTYYTMLRPRVKSSFGLTPGRGRTGARPIFVWKGVLYFVCMGAPPTL